MLVVLVSDATAHAGLAVWSGREQKTDTKRGIVLVHSALSHWITGWPMGS